MQHANNRTNGGAKNAPIATPPAAVYTDCRLCGGRLFYKRERYGRTDDMNRGVCAECQGRPEAARFGFRPVSPGGGYQPKTPTPPRPPHPPQGGTGAVTAAPRTPRAFTAAEKSLIKQLHGHLPAAELLRILNDRLVADVGDRHAPYTLEQLHTEVQTHTAAQAGWTHLRRQIAYARKEGVLAACTSQVVEDFCVAFQLAPGQAMALKDVVRHAREEG